MHQHQKTHSSECLVHSSVDRDHVTSPAAAGQQRKGIRGLVRRPNPAALQITPLTKPTGTPQSGRTVCTSSKIRGEPGDNIPAQIVRRLQS